MSGHVPITADGSWAAVGLAQTPVPVSHVDWRETQSGRLTCPACSPLGGTEGPVDSSGRGRGGSRCGASSCPTTSKRHLYLFAGQWTGYEEHWDGEPGAQIRPCFMMLDLG